MANPQLVAYIREHYGKFGKEALEQSLITAGWQSLDIVEAFEEFTHIPAQPAVPPVPTPILPTSLVTPAAAHIPVQPPVQPVHITLNATTTTPLAIKTAPVPTNPSTFVAEMQRRRQEAEALHPSTTVADGIAFTSVPPEPITEQMGIVGMLIRMKLAKNEQQANIIMISGVVACLALAAWFLL